MAIQHSVISDPHLHEPKGISQAGSGEVYVANGSGSGSWGNLPVSSLSGNTASFSREGDRLVVNNSGGIGSEFGASIGVLSFTGNSTAFTVTDDSYAKIFGASAPWDAFLDKNSTMDAGAGSISAPVAGIYKVSATFVVDGTGYSGNIKIKFVLSSGIVVPFEHIFSEAKGGKGTLSLDLIAELEEDEEVTVEAAGDGSSGSVTFISSSFRVEHLGAS